MPISESWETLAPEFYCDDSLRDLYVLKTTIEDWRKAAKFLETGGFPFEFLGKWNKDEFPPDVRSLLCTSPDDYFTSLSFDIGGLTLNCHFFCPEEIEFHFDPIQVDGQDSLTTLLNFMKQLANAVGKDVVLTPENSEKIVLLRARPGVNEVEHRS